jgi:hypothetical protein
MNAPLGAASLRRGGTDGRDTSPPKGFNDLSGDKVPKTGRGKNEPPEMNRQEPAQESFAWAC